MNRIIFYGICMVGFFSCTNKKHNAEAAINDVPSQETSTKFFPVTNFIKGQILEIKKNGANPLKITTVKQHSDSAWIKMEDLQTELSAFLQPVIDTGNLTAMFSEKKFLDQTLDAYTFTYDPINILPDSMQLLHWDVYVNPADGKIKRIYMVKKADSASVQQLTWQAGKWGKIVTLKNTAGGNTIVAKEQMIIWNF